MTPDRIAHLTFDDIIGIAATYQHRPLTDAVLAALAIASVAVDNSADEGTAHNASRGAHTMTPGLNLTQTMDATVWAREWVRIARDIDAANDGRQVIDEGWMIGWFANAIMTGYDHAQLPIRVKTSDAHITEPTP